MMLDILWIVVLTWLGIILARRMIVGRISVLDDHVVQHVFVQYLQALDGDITVEQSTGESVTLRRREQLSVIQLDQLQRRCAEIPAHSMELIRQAANHYLQAIAHHETELDDWQRIVVPLLLHTGLQLPPGLVTAPFVDELIIGYAINLPGSFRWLTEHDLLRLETTREDVHALALRNLERSCNMLEIDTPGPDAEGYERLLRFITDDGLDASRLLIPSFYQRFSPRFDNADLLVAIPTRDTLVLLSDRDSAMAKMLALRNTWEMLHRAYPLYEKIMLVKESTITPWSPQQLRSKESMA